MSLDLFIWPMEALANGTRPVISDGFKATAIEGVRRQHLGVDVMFRRAANGVAKPPSFTKGFFCESGVARVLSAGPGKVSSVDVNDPHGIFVVIDHGIIAGAGPRATAYRHLATIAVKKGDTVAAGQFLGFAGADKAAGASSPNHLHFELWDTARPRAEGQGLRAAFSVDPAPAMRAWRVKTSVGFTSPDISPAGGEDAGESDTFVPSNAVAAYTLADLAVIPGGYL